MLIATESLDAIRLLVFKKSVTILQRLGRFQIRKNGAKYQTTDWETVL